MPNPSLLLSSHATRPSRNIKPKSYQKIAIYLQYLILHRPFSSKVSISYFSAPQR